MQKYLNYLLLILVTKMLVACSGLEKTEYNRLRRQNCTAEFISRHHDEYFYPIVTPTPKERPAYPWEEMDGSDFPKITKEFFRCKGKSTNKTQQVADCEGSKHGLPLIKGKPNIYPILLQLLNYLQKKTKNKVIITCGHRCPTHNSYADSSKLNRTSKHMIGAEVDFYIQGLEDKPLEIAQLLMDFYKENPLYQGQTDYQTFQRYEKEDTNVSIKPWFNKEIFIKVFKEKEGRDFDNQHPYPYISIQVRYDKEASERVVYSWDKAKNYR